jgi:hypothetical protein
MNRYSRTAYASLRQVMECVRCGGAVVPTLRRSPIPHGLFHASLIIQSGRQRPHSKTLACSGRVAAGSWSQCTWFFTIRTLP